MKPKYFLQSYFRLTELLILIFIATTLFLKFHLLFLLNIDVDEFTFLSLVHRYTADSLGNPFYTFHVHLFSWLPMVSMNEIDQIMAARLVMFSFFVGSSMFTYLIAKYFLNTIGALFSVLCYVSISNIIIHGTSFRFDPICSLLFLMAVYLFLKKPGRNIGISLSGFCMALSMMISLKSLFYMVTFFVLFLSLLYISEDRRETVINIILFCVSFLVCSLLLFMYHSYVLLDMQNKSILLSAGENVKHHVGLKLFFNGYIHNWQYILIFIIENIVVVSLMISGLILIIYKYAIDKNIKNNNILILSFLVNYAPLIYYRYNHPYFYVFILSPAVILCGIIVNNLEKINDVKMLKKIPMLISFLSLIVFFNFIYHYKNNAFDQNISNKEIVDSVHKMFSMPVPYIDRCSMISSFPSVGLQMTTHDMERYSIANNPIMRDIIVQQKPVFIVANTIYLDLRLPYNAKAKDIFFNYPLLEKDFQVLKHNYIHHWGKVYVSGKHFVFNSESKYQEFEILIPGIYTIESGENVLINDVNYKNGDIISLRNEKYIITPKKTPSETTIRWGENLYKPDYDPSLQPVFFGYYPFYSKDGSKLNTTKILP
jgi:hypothetical protein